MKVFVLKGTCGGERKVSLGADSAVLRPGEPVFLPESGNAARLAVIPAVRIGRLGYCVRSNFASYVDAATLFMYLQPDDSDTPSWLPPFIADRSFSPGKWTALPTDGNLRAQVQLSPLPGRTGSTEILEFATSLPALEVERYIRELSQYCTLKTGDLLLFADCGTELRTAVLDTALQATLNDEKVLDIRLK